MAKPIKKERNRLVVELREKKKWTFKRIADELGLKAKSTVHEIYYNEKRRSALTS